MTTADLVEADLVPLRIFAADNGDSRPELVRRGRKVPQCLGANRAGWLHHPCVRELSEDAVLELVEKAMRGEELDGSAQFEVTRRAYETRVAYAPICGAYALFEWGRIVYVGKSLHVQDRIATHWTAGRIKFDSWSLLEECGPAVVSAREAYYLKLLRPKYNSVRAELVQP